MDEKDRARSALSGIPAFPNEAVQYARLTRLRGLTNVVWKVDAAGERFSLRIPGPGTSAIIDRSAEEVSARAAAAAGVAPEVLYFGEDGVMLTRFVNGATMLGAAAFRTRPGAVERAGHALRQLHLNAGRFGREFRVFDIMQQYLRILGAARVVLPSELTDLLGRTEDVRDILRDRPVPLRPCHCDPTGGNLLDTGTRVMLIDWEYAGMNDPAWDLAYLSLEAGFDEALDRRLLAAYHGRRGTEAQFARVAAIKPICDLLSILWARIQGLAAGPAAPYEAEARARLQRCAALLDAVDFADHLSAVRSG